MSALASKLRRTTLTQRIIFAVAIAATTNLALGLTSLSSLASLASQQQRLDAENSHVHATGMISEALLQARTGFLASQTAQTPAEHDEHAREVAKAIDTAEDGFETFIIQNGPQLSATDSAQIDQAQTALEAWAAEFAIARAAALANDDVAWARSASLMQASYDIVTTNVTALAAQAVAEANQASAETGHLYIDKRNELITFMVIGLGLSLSAGLLTAWGASRKMPVWAEALSGRPVVAAEDRFRAGRGRADIVDQPFDESENLNH